jgi:EmrB/QacA subfamily drug resistance transporter
MGAEPSLSPEPVEEAGSYHWLVLSVTSLGVLLVGINASSLNVALPVVVRNVHAGPLEASWFLLAYMLTNTVLILFFGRLADIFGRRTLYIIGFAVFTLSCFLLGLAPNALVLIGLRVVQAAGGALIITNTTPILTDSFPRRLLGQALGLNVAIAAVSQLLGPAVGGLLVTVLDWRWIFWFNVPVGVIGLAWAIYSLRPSPAAGRREPIDLAGALITFVAISGLLIGLSEAGVVGWSAPIVLIGIGVFAVLMPVLLYVEWRQRFPLIDLSLFRDWTYSMANVTTFLNSFARFSPVVLIALFLQAADNESPFAAGLAVLPVSIGMLIASAAAGFMSRRYSARVLSTTGLALTAVGMAILLLAIDPGVPYLPIGIGLSLLGIGSGLFMTPNTTSIMSRVPVNRRGIANGLRSMLQNTAVVISTALSLTIVTGGLAAAAKQQAYSGTLARLSPSALSTFVQGYRMVFFIMTVACIIGVICSYSRGGPIQLVERQRA